MIRVATAPMNWNNDDLPDLRPKIPIGQVLAEMVEAGYEGTEYGTGLPGEPKALRALLAPHGLALASMFCWVRLEDPTVQPAEIERAMGVARTLSAMEVRELILGIRGSAERVSLAGRVPRDGSASLSSAQWRLVADGIHRLARGCAPLGVRLAVHPHAGSYVETRAELDTLFSLTDANALGLCVDAGHLVYGGADPVEVVEAYGPRIWYIHIKDVNPGVLALSTQNGLGFLGALQSYIFCDLGRGCVDLRRFMQALRKVNYSGWMVIEQDTSPKPPLDTAMANRRYLKETFGL
ncbi:MAG TPA: sugar phosphate isomerase/epimerase [Candidatus Methylomirabilis sp.]|nr:sugar phosphate isomerase/epimerase [Candidatus Methylomirabilis sp.]